MMCFSETGEPKKSIKPLEMVILKKYISYLLNSVFRSEIALFGLQRDTRGLCKGLSIRMPEVA